MRRLRGLTVWCHVCKVDHEHTPNQWRKSTTANPLDALALLPWQLETANRIESEKPMTSTIVHYPRKAQKAAVVMAHIEHEETLKALEEATENGKGVLVERHLEAGITKIFVTDKVAPGMVHYDTVGQAPAAVEFDAVAFEMGL